LAGDQIYNGALDNASGTAAMMEIAEAFTKLPTPPKRTVVFLAVTAEEKGLLGAKYYAENPLYPLNRTLANINMDGVNQWGRTRDITMVGDDNSTLIDLLRETAAAQSRTVKPDPEPQKASTIVRIISSLPNRACPRSTPMRAMNSWAKTRVTASRSETSTRRRIITRSRTR
jgi:Zn-dependent M28 family amino/carboxypeptidase